MRPPVLHASSLRALQQQSLLSYFKLFIATQFCYANQDL